MHRTTGHPFKARAFLRDAHTCHESGTQAQVARERGAGSVYGTATGGGDGEKTNGARGRVDLRVHVGSALGLGETARVSWVKVLKEVGALLDASVDLSGSEVDLSSRLESQIAMMWDEIALKWDMLGRR